MAATTFKPPTTPPGRVSEFEYGTLLDDWFADTPTELVYPLNIQTYSAMRRDSSVAAIQQGYTLQLRRAQWQLDGRGCDPAVTQMVADDMGLPILGDDMPGAARTRGVSWSEHLRVALSQALTFGHSGFALGADVSSGEARLNVLAERPPWTINEIHVDPITGAFLGVTQDGFSSANTPQIPARNMAWYCLDREGANWAGRSMYYSAWLPWLIKREMIRVHASSNRRWGAGVPVMEALPGTNPGQAEMQAAAAMASAARAGEQAGAASPPGFQLKILGLSGAVPDTLKFVEWLDRQITRASLMSHLELGQGSSGGAYALGAAFIDSWVLALETLGESIADTATRQVAARIVGWNRGEDEPCPQVTVAGVGSRREITAEALQLLLTSGALTAEPALEAWVRKEYRLPEATPAPVVAPGVTLPGQPGAVAPDGTGMPATAASTDDGLIAAALAAANARNWGALDEVAAQMQTRETATTAAGNPDPQWAEIADDEGEDWKVDAALARGADVPSAYKSIYGTGDDMALQRGFDVWAADQQVMGSPTAGTVDDFKALVNAAAAPTLTLDLDNRVVAVAVRLGRFSALIAQPLATCPYKGADPEQTALRRVWVTSYLRLRSAAAPAPSATPADTKAQTATPSPPAAAPVKASAHVVAAAGHPGSCAHATLGSVCHCACGGVRHSWLGGAMPSAVKAPQPGTSDGQSSADLAGLSGHKAPAGLSGEKAPAPPSNKQTPPSQPAPADTAPAEGRTDPGVDGAPFVEGLIDSDLPSVVSNTADQQAAAAAGRERIAAVVNGTFARLTTEVTRVERHQGGPDGEDPGVQFAVVIRDADGNQVGHAERAIYRDADGTLAAYHMDLELDPDVQGRGFASAFNRHLEDWYRAEGVNRIELNANIDVGGYAWASHGYDFADENSAEQIFQRLSERLGAADPASRTQARELLRRADLPFGSDGYPTAFEISQIGRTPGAASWLGRDAMLESAWEGVRWL